VVSKRVSQRVNGAVGGSAETISSSKKTVLVCFAGTCNARRLSTRFVLI
jgi:hypothetical protein